MKTKDYVGKFVEARGNFGMIDACYGDRLGFIHSDKNSWTGQLVDIDEVRILEAEEEIAMAAYSAKQYLIRERASLKARIAAKLEMDNPDKLRELLEFVSGWIVRLPD